jgi:hypothetical protein
VISPGCEKGRGGRVSEFVPIGDVNPVAIHSVRSPTMETCSLRLGDAYKPPSADIQQPSHVVSCSPETFEL